MLILLGIFIFGFFISVLVGRALFGPPAEDDY